MSQAVGAQPSGWGLLVMGMVVLLLAGLSCAAYLLLFRGGGGRAVQRGAARRRLADQLARGQITEQEYRHLSLALDATRAGSRRRGHTPARRAPRHRDRGAD